MQKDILVSVIIPAYKCRATIGKAIESALVQDVPLEVIVIEDCSPEPIEDIVTAFEDDRIRFYRNEHNIGASKSRNLGVQYAKGEYVAFLDADDYWLENKLSRQYAMLKDSEYVLCSTARELMKPDGTRTGRVIPVKEEITYRDLLKQNWINNSSVLIRKEILIEFPFEVDELHEDFLLWLRILQKYDKACAINEPLLIYRVSNTGKSGSKFQSAIKTYKTYRKLGLNVFASMKSFICYCFAGVKKYYM